MDVLYFFESWLLFSTILFFHSKNWDVIPAIPEVLVHLSLVPHGAEGGAINKGDRKAFLALQLTSQEIRVVPLKVIVPVRGVATAQGTYTLWRDLDVWRSHDVFAPWRFMVVQVACCIFCIGFNLTFAYISTAGQSCRGGLPRGPFWQPLPCQQTFKQLKTDGLRVCWQR